MAHRTGPFSACGSGVRAAHRSPPFALCCFLLGAALLRECSFTYTDDSGNCALDEISAPTPIHAVFTPTRARSVTLRHDVRHRSRPRPLVVSLRLTFAPVPAAAIFPRPAEVLPNSSSTSGYSSIPLDRDDRRWSRTVWSTPMSAILAASTSRRAAGDRLLVSLIRATCRRRPFSSSSPREKMVRLWRSCTPSRTSRAPFYHTKRGDLHLLRDQINLAARRHTREAALTLRSGTSQVRQDVTCSI
jgi:hypothetical protein